MKRGGKLEKGLRTAGEYVLSIGVFVLIWWIYVTAKDVPAYILPAPDKVLKSLTEMFMDGSVYPHLWTTAYEVVLGFLIGSFLGILLGYVFTKADVLKTMLMPYLIFLQTAPKIALVPLFVVWFGIGLVSKVVLIISMVLFPVLSGMMLGLESIPPDVRNLMKILKASRWQVFSKVESAVFPSGAVRQPEGRHCPGCHRCDCGRVDVGKTGAGLHSDVCVVHLRYADASGRHHRDDYSRHCDV